MFLAEYITSVTTWALAIMQQKTKLYSGMSDIVLFKHLLVVLFTKVIQCMIILYFINGRGTLHKPLSLVPFLVLF